MQLTKDADKLACTLYKEYLSKRKSGVSKSDAKYFESIVNLLPDWHPDDIDETLSELKRAGFVKRYVSGDFVLLDDLIIYMENRFKNGLTEVTDFITKFIP